MSKWKVGLLGLMAVGCSLWLSGCLVQEITTVVRYDAQSDVFAVFTVYEHFRSSRNNTAIPANKNPTPADYAHGEIGKLKEIWEGRDRLIPLGPVTLDGPLKTFLTEDRHNLTADPKSNAPVEWPAGEPTISWQKLQIIPGKLFEDRNGMIGYWHEVRIPGSVVDELLAFARVQFRKNKELIELLDVEDEDRKVGKKLGQWADLAEWLKKKIESAGKEEESKDGSMEFERRLLNCLEARSLAAIDKAVRKGELDLSRSGETIRLKLALTARDAQGIAGALRQINNSLIELEKSNSDQRGETKIAYVLRAALESTAKLSADENGLAIEVNSVALLNKLFTAAREEQAKVFSADPKAKVDGAAMAKEAKDWQGGAIEKGVEVEKLLAEFNSRKLEGTGKASGK